MDALIIYPENKEQLAALKAARMAMKITFEQKSNVYPHHVIDDVRESLKQAEESKLIPYNGIKDMLNIE
jgi:hypothetical protein